MVSVLYLGTFPDIEELFPMRLKSPGRQHEDTSVSIISERRPGPVSTGIGFFTPEGPIASNSGGPGRTWLPQALRLDAAPPRDSM